MPTKNDPLTNSPEAYPQSVRPPASPVKDIQRKEEEAGPYFNKPKYARTWDDEPSPEEERLSRDPSAPRRPEEDPLDTSEQERRMSEDRERAKKKDVPRPRRAVKH